MEVRLTIASNSRQVDYVRHVRNDKGRRSHLSALVALAVWELVGMAAIVCGYQIGFTTLSNTSEFAWFWIGMFLIELPLVGLICRRATSRAMRLALLTFYGLVSYAPKLLRSPLSPVYHDEFAHWRATDEILKTGKLFQPNPIISIISQYPGLHAATAALVNATGLTIWQAATVLLIIFHVTMVLGIATLAESLGLDNRTSSLAAIIYGLNSSFLYFDTQYSYESMAITLLVWAMVAYTRAIRSQPRQGRAAWSTLTVVLSAGTVITHHLSALALLLLMTFISLAASIPKLARGEGWVRTAVTAWSLALTTAVMLGVWVIFVAPGTLAYLSPYIGGGFSELLHFLHGSGGSRQLFTASLSPWWEQKAAYLITVFALAAAVGGLFLIHAWIKNGHLPRGGRRALLFAFGLWGLVYFPSNVFILFPFSAEGAHRSWAFTWIGLSILASPATVWLLNWVGRRKHGWQRASMRCGLMGALVVALVGGTAAGLNASYRLPGPFLYGSDARSLTPELLAVSAWFSARFGNGNNIVTDGQTGLIFGSFGLQNPSAPSPDFPIYDLYADKPGAPIEPPYLLSELSSSHFLYLIVDQRMGYEIPQVGNYFSPGEPAWVDMTYNGKPIFYGRLGKFNTISWMVKVFQSGNYSVYRFNFPVAKVGYNQKHLPTSRGKLSVTP
jgi:hypothetical protein